MGVDPQVAGQIAGEDGHVVDRLQIVERELERAARPRHDLEDGALDLLLQRRVHRVRRQRPVGDKDLPERQARALDVLLAQGVFERLARDGPAVDEKLTQALRTGGPGADDATLVEADLGPVVAARKRQRPRAAAEMDELQRVADRDVFEVAGEAHGPPRRLVSRA